MSFSGLFCSKSKYILFLQTKYVYCVYPAIQKVHNNKILLKRAETSIILLCFKGDLYHVRTETSIILLCFHGDLYHVGVYCYCFLSSLYIQVSKKLYQVHD